MTSARARQCLWAVVTYQVLVLVVMVVSDVYFSRVGRPDLQGFDKPEIDVLVLGLLTSAVVGTAIVRSQPLNGAGWAFLGLSSAMLTGFLLDLYALWTVQYRPGSLPGTGVAAELSDSDWIPWFIALAWILYLTPTGTHLSPRWRIAALVTTVAGLVCLFVGFVSNDHLSGALAGVDNPMTISAIATPARWISFAGAVTMGVGLVVAGVSVVVRFRRSVGDERRQLLWLVTALVPLPLFVLAAFVASGTDNQVLTVLATAGFVTLIPVAAGLSIMRYRLYDVERILSTTTTYTVLTLALVGTYALVVWGGARLGSSRSTSPEVTATVGALAAATLANPLRRGIQDLVDRRFNRRAYDARRLVAAALADEDPGIDLQALFRRATGDASLEIAYPLGADWVSGDGTVVSPAPDALEVHRHGRLVSRISSDPAAADVETVRSIATLAGAELDNARLRAELEQRVEEISASRRRLATAQRSERRRIERDLHDGAQQSLLALAFDLQSARVNGDPARMREALAQGTTAARDAVRELRELANGLHPAALADGGLPAAVDDMARHSPVPLTVTAITAERLAPAVEFTAWFVICEAVVNAQKRARASSIEVAVRRADDRLHVEVSDDGRGGANPAGPGLRGMRDRVEAASGSLDVRSNGVGTRIEVTLPCGS